MKFYPENLRTAALMFLVAMALVIASCGPVDDPVDDPDDPDDPDGIVDEYGGTLRIAWAAEPSMLDIQATAHTSTRYVVVNIFELLFAMDEDFQPQPMLAEDYSVSEDGTTYTITLRQGVPFHDGQEMTSDDVVASLERWGRVSGVGGTVFDNVISVDATDTYEVEVQLEEPSFFFLSTLATERQGPGIYPKSLIDEYGDDAIGEAIGTGPFKMDEWARDDFIRLVRFEDYVPRDEEPDGYTGRRTAYVDEIIYQQVVDPSVRAMALEAGDYDISLNIAGEDYERLDSDPSISIVRSAPTMPCLTPNKKHGVLSEDEGYGRLLRQAIMVALDKDEINLATFGHPDVYRVNPSYMYEESAYYTEAGSEGLFNQGDTERAREMAEEAGYQGEPIRLAVTEGTEHYDSAVVITDQLERAGFEIDLMALDGATFRDYRSAPDLVDMFISGQTWRPHPILLSWMHATWPGFFDDDHKDELLAQMLRSPTWEEEYAVWEELHEHLYYFVPSIKLGETYVLTALSDDVEGYLGMPEPAMWNVRLTGN